MTNIMEEMQAHVERSRDDSKRLLRFRGISYREGDVIVLCVPHLVGEAQSATLLLVTYNEEFGITELLPLGFEVLHVLNPEKYAAVCEMVDKLRNPAVLYDTDGPIHREYKPGDVVFGEKG